MTSLLEFWAHHEDVLAANGQRRCDTNVDLSPVVKVLVRYQRRLLKRHAVCVTSAGALVYKPTTRAEIEVDGAVTDIARWLSGRGPVTALSVSSSSDRADALAAERFHL